MKVLLTHTPGMRDRYYGEKALAALRAVAEIRLHEGDRALDAAGLIAAARDMDAIIADRMTPAPAEIFAALPTLQAFLRCAVDISTIDIEAASRAGVLVTRAGPGFVESVSELALGYLVDLSRGISRAVADYRTGKVPHGGMGRQLSGSVLGLIGYGSIARHLAPLAATLGMTVLVSDPLKRVQDTRFNQVTLDQLLTQADYVVCLAVANDATENLMGAQAFARMKSDAFFINMSRGSLVDEDALTAALMTGRIAGAAMDVGRADDQMPSPALACLKNVIATPHIGGLTPLAVESQAIETVHQATVLARGEIPFGAVNAAHWTRRLISNGTED